MEDESYNLSKGKERPINNHIVASTNLRNNYQVLSFARTYTAVVAGIVCGVLGVMGLQGFAYHFASQLLCVVPMLAKGSMNVEKYFMSWLNLITVGVFSQNNIMAFILSWMMFYNICYVF